MGAAARPSLSASRCTPPPSRWRQDRRSLYRLRPPDRAGRQRRVVAILFEPFRPAGPDEIPPPAQPVARRHAGWRTSSSAARKSPSLPSPICCVPGQLAGRYGRRDRRCRHHHASPDPGKRARRGGDDRRSGRSGEPRRGLRPADHPFAMAGRRPSAWAFRFRARRAHLRPAGRRAQLTVGYRGTRDLIFELGNTFLADDHEFTPETWAHSSEESTAPRAAAVPAARIDRGPQVAFGYCCIRKTRRNT